MGNESVAVFFQVFTPGAVVATSGQSVAQSRRDLDFLYRTHKELLTVIRLSQLFVCLNHNMLRKL